MSTQHKALLLAVLPSLLVGAAVRAEDAKAAAPAPAKPAAAAPAAAEGRPYVDAGLAFLKGLTHSSRKGAQGDEGWAAVKENAADKVTLKVGAAASEIDVAGKKSEWALIKFTKVSTLRDGAKVTGIAVESLELKKGADEHKGKGKLLMTETAGKWTVTAIEVE